MRKGSFTTIKKVASRPAHFDKLAEPFFSLGNEVGCAVLHGFTGTPANIRPVADSLAGAGFSVYAPLLSGHGATLRHMDKMTYSSWLDDAFSAYERLFEAGCRRIYMLGLSMGGLLAAIVAAEREVSGIVLLNAPFIMKGYLHKAASASAILPIIPFGRGRPTRDPLLQGYAGVPMRKLKDLERISLKARGCLHKVRCPALILQSVNDNRVDMASVSLAKFGMCGADVECIPLKNSAHVCTVGPEKELVAAYCHDFVEKIERGFKRGCTDG